ncbi:MAG: dockerin type I repeat-containing protein [Dehalococcoidia bacterium]|nr:dockerin type I repeat-containing protein [Dehalococcoidia bacterium]
MAQGVVPPGGKLSTGSNATEDDTVETSVIVPNGGKVTIIEGPLTEAGAGGQTLIGQQVEIEAPSATTQEPLIVTFLLDVSIIPEGQDESTVQLYYNGEPVPDCSGPSGKAQPNPCVFFRWLLTGSAAGDVLLQIFSSDASTWTFSAGLAGDVDCNGIVDSVDAALILQFAAGLVGPLPCHEAGDVDLDGDVGAVDAALILQLDAGLIPSLPVGHASRGWGAGLAGLVSQAREGLGPLLDRTARGSGRG